MEKYLFYQVHTLKIMIKILILKTSNIYENFINYSNLENFDGSDILYADNFNLKNNSIVIILKEKELEFYNEKIKFYNIFSAHGKFWIKNIDKFQEL